MFGQISDAPGLDCINDITVVILDISLLEVDSLAFMFHFGPALQLLDVHVLNSLNLEFRTVYRQNPQPMAYYIYMLYINYVYHPRLSEQPNTLTTHYNT